MNINLAHTELTAFLTNNDSMREAAKSSFQQGLWAGGGALTLGLVFGPVGGLVGGIAGSIIGYFKSNPYDGAGECVLEGGQNDGVEGNHTIGGPGLERLPPPPPPTPSSHAFPFSFPSLSSLPLSPIFSPLLFSFPLPPPCAFLEFSVVQLSALPASRKQVLLDEVSELLVSAGAVLGNLQLAGGLASALEEFATQPAVRDGIWRGCVAALR